MPHTPVTLRPAAPGDADELLALVERVLRADVTSDPALLADTLENVSGNVRLWLDEPARCVLLVAFDADERIVGMVQVKDFWNLCSLFVASERQGEGLGRRLLEAVDAACRARSPKDALWLNAAANAVGFYRRLGFETRESARPLPPGFEAMWRRW